ncbi:MAG TPA: hypothetical protein VF980_02500 [Thermoanaerobaculia bacterium]
MVRRLTFALIVLLAYAMPALAEVRSVKRTTREYPMYLGGTFVVENAAGDVEVLGSDDPKAVIVMEKTVRATDNDALEDGVQQTIVRVLGDEKLREVQTVLPAIHSDKWTSAVKFMIKVPRTVHVKIISLSATRIHVANIRGNVSVKSFDGSVLLDGVTGASIVDTANGNVIFNAPAVNLSNAQLSSVNGTVEVHAPANASFQWVGETIKGEALTTFPARVTFLGTRFRGGVNAPGGPTITTQSLTGNVAVLQNGVPMSQVKRLQRPDTFDPAPFGPPLRRVVQTIRQQIVQGTFEVSTRIGNVAVGEIRGNARVTTGAGEVQLGSVFGNCHVTSLGGPLNIGDVLGAITARTEAGDVLVQAARNGGTITTGGGTIRLLYTGGDTRLQSGGGDIIVRQAAGPINAETQSGDITIAVDGGLKTEKVTAKTAKGNVMLNVAPAFGADIDATVITSDPDVNNIVADIPSLQVRREEIGGKTKIRATGKLNGGGDRVELYAEDGSIQINTHAGAPVTVITR